MGENPWPTNSPEDRLRPFREHLVRRFRDRGSEAMSETWEWRSSEGKWPTCKLCSERHGKKFTGYELFLIASTEFCCPARGEDIQGCRCAVQPVSTRKKRVRVAPPSAEWIGAMWSDQWRLKCAELKQWVRETEAEDTSDFEEEELAEHRALLNSERARLDAIFMGPVEAGNEENRREFEAVYRRVMDEPPIEDSPDDIIYRVRFVTERDSNGQDVVREEIVGPMRRGDPWPDPK